MGEESDQVNPHRELKPYDMTSRSVCSCGFSTRTAGAWRLHMETYGGVLLSAYEGSKITEMEVRG